MRSPEPPDSPEPTGGPELPSRDELERSARAVLAAHWREPGFTCPNATTYPWLWLWDSCFHSIVWAELGEDERALSELSTALAAIGPTGFVPHLRYLDGTRRFDEFWGIGPQGPGPSTSSITQPPVHALALSELVRRGVEVPEPLVDRSVEALRFLVQRRRRSTAGLVELVHPWESGCDHSPRWDDLMAAPGTGTRAAGEEDPYDETHWFDRKGELLATIERDEHGAPLANPAFAVGSVAFTAITAHAGRLVGDLTGDAQLLAAAGELAEALAARWDHELETFVDDGPTAAGSGRVRTAEALLGVLVVHDPAVVRSVAAQLTDPTALGGAFGPAQVHRSEPTFRRRSYWRGPSWPQLDHLLVLGLASSGDADGQDAARRIGAAARAGAWRSGWAEYWDPDDGAPGGAVPQSWSTLALLWGEPWNETV